MSGYDLDAGANADYQRALDAYESAKTAGDSITQPEVWSWLVLNQ